MVSEIKTLALEMLNMVDLIVQQNVGSPIILPLYKKLVLPFLRNKILTTDDKLIKENLQVSYDKLRPFFEKKQIKDMIDEGEKLGSPKISDLSVFKEVSEYF